MVRQMFKMKRGLSALIITTILVMVSLIPVMYAFQDEVEREDVRKPFLLGNDTATLPPLHTRWGTFTMETLYQEIPFNEEDLNGDIWMVQFDGPIEKSWRDDLSNSGFEILDYLPEFTYIVRVADGIPSDLLDLDHFVSAGPFPSGMKMDPGTYEDLDGRENIRLATGQRSLVVDTFEAGKDIKEALEKISPQVEKASSTRYLIGPTIKGRDDLLSVHGISHIEPYYEMELHNNVSKDIIQVQEVWDDLGLDGTGQIVAIADSGLDTGVDNHLVNGDINLDFDNRATIVNWAGTSGDDGHSHGTHVAGSVAGDGTNSGGDITGMAPNASIYFQAIMTDGGSLQIPANTSELFIEAYENGSRIHTNSWGSSVAGQYISRSQDVDRFLFNHPDMIILYSAGNSGYDWYPEDGKVDPDSIGSPGTAKNCITVGASENYRMDGGSQGAWGSWGAWRYLNGSWVVYSKFPEEPIYSDLPSDNTSGLAAFSSRGPTDDGRIKPDVVAPGTNILSCRSSVSGAGTGWGVYNNDYIYMGGTSMSTPITAGAVVLMREYFNSTLGMDSPSGALLKASLINGAVDLTPGQYGEQNSTVQEIQGRPDMHQGWGRINISNSLQPDGGNMTFIDDKKGVWTGTDVTSRIEVKGSDRELKVTLAYSDYPGALYASKELVNDLDLVLIAPNGTRYHGNDWLDPFNDTRDSINPVEGISIPSPAPGTWKIMVKAFNVPMGPQHFAVVATGDISNVSSVISLDRSYYSTEGDKITIKVIDPDLVGNGTVPVTLNSTTSPSGISLVLKEEASSGLFIGSAWTTTASPGNSSTLKVSDNDTISAQYRDDDPAETINHTSIAKDPVKVLLKDNMEHRLVQSEHERIFLEGRIETGIAAWWSLDGSGFGWKPFHDDGNSSHGDLKASDGNISDVWIVPRNLTGNFTLLTRVSDPFLGNRTYEHFNMTFNSSVPRYPKNVTVEVSPEGNSVNISWSLSNETDISHFNIYINETTGTTSGKGMMFTGWRKIASTTGIEDRLRIHNLTDGTTYSFRVSAVDLGGNESSPSALFNATPSDTISPEVSMITTPTTIVGRFIFEFTGSPDLEKVRMEFYNDLNGNGMTDDGDWESIGEGPPEGIPWDTRKSAGGPGDVDSLFIRYRGSDEANNTGTWKVDTDFHVDNTGPATVSFTDPPPSVTNIMSHQLSGTSEAESRIEIRINGEVRTNTTCNALGGFETLLNLSEGRNHVILSAYDRFGAGPTNMSYNFTLDRQDPEAIFDTEDQNNITREIMPEIFSLASASVDSGSDPIFTYIENLTWKITDPIGMSEMVYGSTVLRFNFSLLGTYTVRLTVRDPAGNSNSSTLGIEVIDTTAPLIEIMGGNIVDEDETVTFDLNVSDNDLRWFNRDLAGVFWEATGNEMDWNSTEPTAVIMFHDPGTYTLNVTVTDGGGNTVEESLSITVRDITPPEGNILGPRTVTLGIPATFRQNLTDNNLSFPEGSHFRWNLTYQETAGTEPEFFEGVSFTYNFTSGGSYTLILTATDTSGNIREVEILISAIGDITPPSIERIDPAPNSSFQFPEDLMITVTFDEPLNFSTVGVEDFIFEDSSGSKLNITIEMASPTEIRVKPGILEFGETYILKIGTGILDNWNNPLENGTSVNYTIRTLFQLDFPDGVFPSSQDQNFTGNDEDIYNITLSFTNPVQVSSVLNALRVFSIRMEQTSGQPREIREEITFFYVNPGEDEFSVIVSIPLDRGTRYNISLGTEVRDRYDYRLDRVYLWEFKTYIPENQIEDEEDDENENDLPQWVLDPTIWIIVAAIVILLLIIIAVIARSRRKKNLEKIWEAGTDEAPRKRTRQEPEPEMPSTEEEDLLNENIEDEIYGSSPAPSYEDLYGGPEAPDFHPETTIQGEESGMEDPIPGGPPEDGDEGIEWDEDDSEEDDEWEDEEEDWD
jgi:hypothetical protein